MNEIFTVYGAEGCGRILIPVVNEYLKRLGNNNQTVFIDNALEQDVEVNGHVAMNYQRFKNIKITNKFVLLATADSDIRQKLANLLIHDDIGLWSLQATSTLIMDSATTDNGTVFSPFITIAANITIGKCSHANLYSYFEHDCVIGDYVTFAPRVSCNGNIHDYAYIGASAVIKQGTPTG